MNENTSISRSTAFLIALIIFSASSVSAETLSFDISIPLPEHSIVGDKHRFTIEDFGTTLDMYRPKLPVKTFYYEIPEDAEDIAVDLYAVSSGTIAFVESISEQLPPLPQDSSAGYAPPARVADHEPSFPREHYKYNGIKHLDGHRVASITVFPLQYNYERKSVQYITAFNFTLRTMIIASTQGNRAAVKKNRSKGADAPIEMLAAEMIANYDESSEEGSLEDDSSGQVPAAGGIPGSTAIKYIIITTSALSSALEPLEDWKSRTGTPARIYTVEDIYANYSASDNAEEIREFLIDMEAAHDLDWILLAGDDADVPARDAYCDDGYAGDGNYVPTDYYYADLEASYSPYDWDRDGDGRYGEVADDIDWMPEAYVGRLSSSNLAQMETMVSNIISYERSPPSGSWPEKVILAGAKADDKTDDAFLMEEVRTDFLGSYDPERLYYLTNYARDYPLTFSDFQSRTGNGAGLVNWAGHGSYTSAHVTSSGSAFVSTSTNPSNGQERPVVYADSCNTGGFDQSSSLGEDIIRDWGIGFIGASRVSFYCQEWSGPNDPWNQAHDYRFFEQIVGNSVYWQGKAFYDSKVDYINDFAGVYGPENHMASRKNLLTYNLLGDPELAVWDSEPSSLVVDATDHFSINQDNTITVTVEYVNGTGMSGATVTLFNDQDVYEKGTTDASGQATFTGVNTASTEPITVTATRYGFIPEAANITQTPFNLTLLSPLDQTFTNPSEINFSYVVNYSESINFCRLYLNSQELEKDESVQNGVIEEYSWENVKGGNYTWKVRCKGTDGVYSSYATSSLKVIKMTSFDGNSTDLSSVDIENITNLVVEKSEFGAINFTKTVNLSGGADLNRKVVIRKNLIEVKSEDIPALNTSAVLTIRGVRASDDPVILRDGETCDDCTVLEVASNYVRFNVSHFSSYSIVGSTVDWIRSGSLEVSIPGNDSAIGGNVTPMNLSSNISTDRWQGYYGNVTGTLAFGYGSYIFYEFSAGEATAVFATQNQSFDFSRLEAGTAADLDTVWNYLTGNDQAVDVYTGNLTNITGVVAPAVELNPTGQNLNSTILDDGSSALKENFAFGAIIQNGATCFDSSSCDYELLVPADGTETYFFYLEVG